MNKFDFSKNIEKEELKIRNKLLNSILLITNLENNNDLCNLLFNNSNIFRNPSEGYIYLSFKEILLNLFKFRGHINNNNYKQIIGNILSNINYDEFMCIFVEWEKNSISHYIHIEFFLSFLIEYINFIKIKQVYINEKILNLIDNITQIKTIKQNKELIKDEKFRKMISKLFFILINVKGTHNIKNNNHYLLTLSYYLNDIKSNNEEFILLLNELFRIFFIDFYTTDDNDNNEFNILKKFQFIESKNELSDLNIKPLNSTLYEYLEKIIKIFSSFTQDPYILNEIINYLFEIQYSYYQIYLQNYRYIENKDMNPENLNNNFIICNFPHVFKSKNINEFYYSLFKYVNEKKTTILQLFPDFKNILINTFNLCPYPSYLILFFEILVDEEKLKENDQCLNEIFEIIINNESLKIKKDSNNINVNKYKKQYNNIIILLISFFHISYYPKLTNNFCISKILEYFYKFITMLKENNIIYSNYLITIYINNEKFQKTILEISFLIIINLLSKKDFSSQIINKNLDCFENRDKNSKEFGESLFFIFDILNKGDDIKDNSYYKNEDFERYLSELNCPKEEKSLLITAFINLIILLNKNIKCNNLKTFAVRVQIILLNGIMISFKKNYGKFKATKIDVIYDLILEQINSIDKEKLGFDNKLMKILIEIINKNINKYKDIDITNLNYIFNDDNRECYLKNNCLLLKQSSNFLASTIKNVFQKKPKLFGDYFYLNSINNVKYFKSDLIFKDCSIFFDEIFFKDKNFISLKNSFLIRYKNLINDDKQPSFNFPTKLKNFSSNKYNSPKVFLECDINFYKSKYFSVCHPTFNLKLLKKDSFPNFPSHYEYFNDLFEKYLYINSFNCELICVKGVNIGIIYACKQFILFKNENNFDYKNLDFIFHSAQEEIEYREKIIVIYYEDIEEIITRSFLYNYQACEILLKNGKSYFFNLYKDKYLYNFYIRLKKMQGKNPELKYIIIEEPQKAFEQNEYIKKWENNELSTYQYLLYINKYSGRSYNDLNQYPIFPWIFLSSKDDNSNMVKLRNMKHFMMTQTERGIKLAKKTYNNSLESKRHINHFSLHYSTSAYIILYLIKISPFTEGNIKLQNGTFDAPNRLIYSYDNVLAIISKGKDNRELIPELFTSIEHMFNLNYNFYGITSHHKLIHNSESLSIFNSPEEFIYFNKLILNNQLEDKNKIQYLPKCEINKWIDNVFGVNQYPPSLEKFNKFDDYAYRQIKSPKRLLEKYINRKLPTEQIIKKLCLKITRILSFGQCPEQIFKNIHVIPKNKEKKVANPQLKKIQEFANININVITFWISEKKLIFFLIKNKTNKKISVSMYDEKLNKKSEIFIDKIKLFSCGHDFFTKESVNNQNDNLNCSIAVDPLANIEIFNSFLVLDNEPKNFDYVNDENYTLKDLYEVYALNPKMSMFDISDDFNTYLFVGRNSDNSIKIYSPSKNNNQLIGQLKTDSFSSCIYKIDKEYFLTGHNNGKLLKWKIIYEIIVKFDKQNNEIKQKKIKKITINKEFYAHNCMISYIHYNERYNIILTSDVKGILYVRKYYDFHLINKIVIKNNNFNFINKVFVNDYDILCTINYNIYKKKNYICFYSINGLLLEESKNNIIINSTFLKNGKIIFNCLNESNLFIFGLNGKDHDNNGIIIEEDILKGFEVKKKNSDYIKNFIIEKNDIYILLKNGIFIKGYYEKLDSLSFGVLKFLNK